MLSADSGPRAPLPNGGYGYGYGYGYGDGGGGGVGYGNGHGHGNGHGYGDGNGNGNGKGYGHGHGYGNGGGGGAGYGYYGYGDGNRCGHGNGDGYGDDACEATGLTVAEHAIVVSPWGDVWIGCRCHGFDHWAERWEKIADEEGVEVSEGEATALLAKLSKQVKARSK